MWLGEDVSVDTFGPRPRAVGFYLFAIALLVGCFCVVKTVVVQFRYSKARSPFFDLIERRLSSHLVGLGFQRFSRWLGKFCLGYGT